MCAETRYVCGGMLCVWSYASVCRDMQCVETYDIYTRMHNTDIHRVIILSTGGYKHVQTLTSIINTPKLN